MPDAPHKLEVTPLPTVNRARGDSIRADIAFHRAIAQAAHNPFYISVLDYLSQFLVTAISVSRGEPVLREDFARQVEIEHLHIVDAIRRKDASAARLAAQMHMDGARIRIRQAGRDFWAKNMHAASDQRVAALSRAGRDIASAAAEAAPAKAAKRRAPKAANGTGKPARGAKGL
jgi:hypothetical protein